MVNATHPAQNGQVTREHIAQVATHLFAQQGFNTTSIRDIAEAAGVTKPVLYYYFQSKENLFVSLIHEAYDFFYQKLEMILNKPGDFWDHLREITQLYFDLGREFGDSIRLLYMAVSGPRRNTPRIDFLQYEKKHFDYLGRLFHQGMEQGFIRPMNIETISTFYLGSISIYLEKMLFTHEPIPEKVDEMILDFVFHGIGGGNR